MEKKTSVESIARISTLAQNVIDSEKNANDLVDLLEYLNVSLSTMQTWHDHSFYCLFLLLLLLLLQFQSDCSIPLLKVSVQSLCRVCSHLVHKNYAWIVPSGSKSIPTSSSAVRRRDVAGKSADVTHQYQQWMRQNYLTFLERLLELTHHTNDDIQVNNVL